MRTPFTKIVADILGDEFIVTNSIDVFIKKQKNVITLILFLILMCLFIPIAKYIALVIIAMYGFVFTKEKKNLMSEIEGYFLKNHTEEYKLYMDKAYKSSVLDINIAPFINSDYFVKTMFDRVFLEKCQEANKINFIIVIMIIALSTTILLIS